MPTTFVLGQLVELTGSTDPRSYPAEWRNSSFGSWSDAPRDLSGERGQLISWDEESGLWLVATLRGCAGPVPERCLRLLKTEDVSGFDVAIGPRSELDVMGSVLSDYLQCQGHARCQMFVSADDLQGMVDVAERCISEGLFHRLPAELESGYLGNGSTGKTMNLDIDASSTQEWITTSHLQAAETAISTVGKALRPYVDSDFGFDIHSRTNTLLVLPFDGDEDAFESRACDNKEAADFVSMMRRAKLMSIVNAGPGVVHVQLTPRPESGYDDREHTLKVQPGMLIIFAPDRFKFTHRAEGKALSLMSWFLDMPRSFGVSELTGDLSCLGSTSSGPPPPRGEHVCVAAVGTRYAFGVDEPWKLWAGYAKAGMDTFSEFPFTRWDLNEYYEEDADQSSGKSYTKHGGFSDGIEYFDCRFFDISPAEARGMDPTQRQVMEVGYIALQGGGYDKKSLSRKSEQVGCFVGLDKNEWIMMPKDLAGGFGASSTANSITSNRFNYSLNLKGPSMTIDTACSASLVATHTAKLYLTNKHWDPCTSCISIGVNLLLSPGSFIACCGAGMLSHKGRCFTYNNTADGYARGECTASACLKLRQWDKEGGDMCVLAGSNVNQDGRSASLTAPNGPSQERCSQSVLREVGITPLEVDTTECHGTGTALGDPIEIGAYRKVMSAVERVEPVIVTSSKSNIGHCEGGAGISGFLKCVLMCMHNEGTPNCHLTGLNPHLDIDGFPASLLTEGIVMRADASYNGVLSFGFGGTNACAQCWGQNIVTSRGSSNKDVYKALIKKIETASREVEIVGEDWEEWKVEGPEFNAKPGDAWELEIDEEGQVLYTRKDEETVYLGDEYFLSGTFNNWEFQSMQADSMLAGLFSGIVTLGARGEEQFQIVADRDDGMTFHPKISKCTVKSSSIDGPESVDSHELTWCLRGDQGDRYRVEFYRSDSNKVSISWARE